jgi:hypothetical protein
MSKWIPPAPKIPLKTDTKMVNLLATLMIVIPPVFVLMNSAFLINQHEKIMVDFISAALISIAGIGIRFRHFRIHPLWLSIAMLTLVGVLRSYPDRFLPVVEVVLKSFNL